ncbi:hypothetical protein EJ03DRAFT_354556 [Teratosphaeria nubilosa]|uniref:Uncharacterized protein n=1 Tax=Teratosphaeria nubilosa TaxID=161662 RepID=A0A6G1KZA9_9PEZI|nr:hypothetical protein EJ03DRAFT_354556 [Teratosphaeria nubilosa]
MFVFDREAHSATFGKRSAGTSTCSHQATVVSQGGALEPEDDDGNIRAAEGSGRTISASGQQATGAAVFCLGPANHTFIAFSPTTASPAAETRRMRTGQKTCGAPPTLCQPCFLVVPLPDQWLHWGPGAEEEAYLGLGLCLGQPGRLLKEASKDDHRIENKWQIHAESKPPTGHHRSGLASGGSLSA